MPDNERFPLQPVYLDERGVARFRENRIVRFLLDNGPHDLNRLAVMAGNDLFSTQEQEQFAMLIGYSVGGFGELSYVSDKAYGEAQAVAERLLVESRDA